jgi:sec-independent protein translocase protein TatB
VLGPEKLPRVVSEVGRWVGRARAMARQFREQLEEEVQLEEARKAQAARTARSSTPGAPPEAGATPPPSPEMPAYPHAASAEPTGASDERRT